MFFLTDLQDTHVYTYPEQMVRKPTTQKEVRTDRHPSSHLIMTDSEPFTSPSSSPDPVILINCIVGKEIMT